MHNDVGAPLVADEVVEGGGGVERRVSIRKCRCPHGYLGFRRPHPKDREVAELDVAQPRARCLDALLEGAHVCGDVDALHDVEVSHQLTALLDGTVNGLYHAPVLRGDREGAEARERCHANNPCQSAFDWV